MKFLELCNRVGAECPSHLESLDVRGVSSRTSEIEDGYVFVCLKGTKNDGHNYLKTAFDKGAVVAVIENDKFSNDNTILVDDARRMLSHMMNVICGEPTKYLRFIAVTGTNGKTSVSAMIKNIFDTLHIPCELIGTLNSSSFYVKSELSQANLTTPDPEELYPMLQRISGAGGRFVVMEASSHALKLKKLDPIRFDVGIFTNLSEDHLDFHKTMEDYFNSKLELFNRCRIGIINIDDEYGEKIVELASCPTKTCSMTKKSDYFVQNIRYLEDNKSRFSIVSNEGTDEMLCNIPGTFSIMNSTQAYACARAIGIDNKYITRSFETFSFVKGRLEKVELFKGRGFAVYIDYAHTPDALLKLLQTARSMCSANGRVVLLFGCGGDREKQKRSLMGKIALEYADSVIITSDNPRSEKPEDIIGDILSGITDENNFTVIPNRAEAIRSVIAAAREGDIILLAGKGHENYEINSQGVFHFDEREVLCEIEKETRREEK